MLPDGHVGLTLADEAAYDETLSEDEMVWLATLARDSTKNGEGMPEDAASTIPSGSRLAVFR